MKVLGVRHRRFHTKTGVALLFAGMLTAVATTQGFVRITGGHLVDVAVQGIGLQGDVGANYAVDDQKRLLLVAVSVGFLVAGCLLLFTRVRGIGLVWRAGAVVCWALSALFVVFGWSFIHDPSGALTGQQSIISRVTTGTISTARALGVIDVQPGPGLYLLTAACAIALVGIVMPAARRTEGVTRPEDYLNG